jgi:hypothetical protein
LRLAVLVFQGFYECGFDHAGVLFQRRLDN